MSCVSKIGCVYACIMYIYFTYLDSCLLLLTKVLSRAAANSRRDPKVVSSLVFRNIYCVCVTGASE